MANKIQIKRGNKANLPALSDGELAYCKDAGQLFVGNGTTSVQVGAAMASGTWTPVVTLTGEYGSNYSGGSYVKIGRMVIAHFFVDFNFGTPTGTFQITGLPYAASAEAAAALSTFTGGFNTTGTPFAVIAAGSSAITFKVAEVMAGPGVTAYTNITTSKLSVGMGSCSIQCTITYMTA